MRCSIDLKRLGFQFNQRILGRSRFELLESGSKARLLLFIIIIFFYLYFFINITFVLIHVSFMLFVLYLSWIDWMWLLNNAIVFHFYICIFFYYFNLLIALSVVQLLIPLSHSNNLFFVIDIWQTVIFNMWLSGHILICVTILISDILSYECATSLSLKSCLKLSLFLELFHHTLVIRSFGRDKIFNSDSLLLLISYFFLVCFRDKIHLTNILSMILLFNFHLWLVQLIHES